MFHIIDFQSKEIVINWWNTNKSVSHLQNTIKLCLRIANGLLWLIIIYRTLPQIFIYLSKKYLAKINFIIFLIHVLQCCLLLSHTQVFTTKKSRLYVFNNSADKKFNDLLLLYANIRLHWIWNLMMITFRFSDVRFV